MIALIDQYQKELLKVNGFAESTVETYTISIKAFCSFAKNELKTNPVNVRGPQLLKWILYLKNTGIGYSRIENHHYALKSFFAFLKRLGAIASNPAESLPLLITRRRQRTKPISTRDAFKLLNSFDQNSWHGLRNYTMVSVFWALGLRTSELTGLKVCSFETGHGKHIGLLRVRGKNKSNVHYLSQIDSLMNSYDTCPIPKHRTKSVLRFSRLIPKQRPSQIIEYSALSKIRQKRPVLLPTLHLGCSDTLLPQRCITVAFLCPTFR